MNNWKNIPNLEGKVAIVTGANSGTGYGIVFHLASHGCKVVMAGRNETKLNEAKTSMLQEAPGANLETEIVDLESLQSIQKFCGRITERFGKIDFLANNAGGGGSRYAQTVDGFEAWSCPGFVDSLCLGIQAASRWDFSKLTGDRYPIAE